MIHSERDFVREGGGALFREHGYRFKALYTGQQLLDALA
jgi:hypothetical protein